MDVILILISWLILLVPGFDDSVPPTNDKIFKITTSSDVVEHIDTIQDEFLDFQGFTIKLKQNATGYLDISIPKNLPRPSSYIDSWKFNEKPIMLADGKEITSYKGLEDQCFSHFQIPINKQQNIEIIYGLQLAGTWKLYTPIEFAEKDQCYKKTIYDRKIPPLKQIQNGIALFDVKCSDDKVPAYKHDNMSVACVTEETHSELITRGWALLRFTLPDENPSHVLCNRYDGKWHPEHNGCRGDISDLQCSLMGGKFVDNLKICYNDICPENKTYTLCVTEQKTIDKYAEMPSVEKLLIENKINYNPDKLVVTTGFVAGGDPGCGAVIDYNSDVYWFSVESRSDAKNMTLYNENPLPCKIQENSCFCSAQTRLAELTKDELSYLSTEEEEQIGKRLKTYFETIPHAAPATKFAVGKYNLDLGEQYTEVCGVLLLESENKDSRFGKGLSVYDYFSTTKEGQKLWDFSFAVDSEKLCAVSDDAKIFEYEKQER